MKLILKSLSVLIGLALIALVIISFIAWARAPDMLASTISKKLKVSVAIDDMHLSLGAIEIDKLEIGNPTGSTLPKAFTSETIRIDAPLIRYLDEAIVIDLITIEDIYLGLEFDSAKSAKGNWTTIMSNGLSTTQKNEKTKRPRKVLIKKLVLKNLSPELVYNQGDRRVRRLSTIPYMEFTNITSDQGIPSDEIMDSVLGQMLQSVFFKENLKNMLQDLILAPTDTIDTFLSPFKGLFGK